MFAAGAVASLPSGNVLFALIKESFLTGVFGLICLGSLLFNIVRQFAAGDDAEHMWNGLFDRVDFLDTAALPALRARRMHEVIAGL